MSRPVGTPNVGIRWDPDMGEAQLRCEDCRRKGRASFWPITLEFWQPQWGWSRCRACWMERKAARNRERWANDPAFRAKKLELNREHRRAMARVMYRQRWEQLRADPVKYEAYLAARRERQRAASARYRAKQREQVAA